MALLGCEVVWTDQVEFLPLLMRNCERYTSRILQMNLDTDSIGSITAAELSWGNNDQIRALEPPLGFIIGTGVNQVMKAKKKIAKENIQKAIKATTEAAEVAISKGKAFCILHVNVGTDDTADVRKATGDKSLKEHMSSEPDISMEIIDGDTEFLILASDGVWKDTTDQEALDCIKNVKDARAAATQPTGEALARKITDDISCIIVKFK